MTKDEAVARLISRGKDGWGSGCLLVGPYRRGWRPRDMLDCVMMLADGNLTIHVGGEAKGGPLEGTKAKWELLMEGGDAH